MVPFGRSPLRLPAIGRVPFGIPPAACDRRDVREIPERVREFFLDVGKGRTKRGSRRRVRKGSPSRHRLCASAWRPRRRRLRVALPSQADVRRGLCADEADVWRDSSVRDARGQPRRPARGRPSGRVCLLLRDFGCLAFKGAGPGGQRPDIRIPAGAGLVGGRGLQPSRPRPAPGPSCRCFPGPGC